MKPDSAAARSASYDVRVSAPRLQIVAVGRPRPPLSDGSRLYEERIRERVSLRVDDVAPEPLQHGIDQVRLREAERIGRRLVPGAHIVALDPVGRAHRSSEDLAGWLGRRLEAPGTTTFVIGGPAGLPPSIASSAAELLSLGTLTLPHQLARVVLAEQIYRALAHLAGHPYAH